MNRRPLTEEQKKSFITLINEHQGLIHKVCILYETDKEARNDLFQEIVLQLWKSFSSFREQSKISTWLYRVALNTSIYFLKKDKRKPYTVPIDMAAQKFTDEFDATETKQLKTLYEHIHQLSLLEKGIILLYLEGKSHEEIAAITGLSKTNVGTKLSRIKEKLKSQINKNI